MHTRADYLISTDPALIDLDAVHAFLSRSYWSPDIPKSTVARAIANSMTFGVYHAPPPARPTQIGLARVITDKATFAYLSDVYILESHRGRGLSKWLVETILAHPDLQGLRRFCLMTRDAHTLYNRYGFEPTAKPANYLERLDRDVYKRNPSGAADGNPQ
jgi:GNAT superfamily N-acetyltransferase